MYWIQYSIFSQKKKEVFVNLQKNLQENFPPLVVQGGILHFIQFSQRKDIVLVQVHKNEQKFEKPIDKYVNKY